MSRGLQAGFALDPGSNLSTPELALVYMQTSGLANALNSLQPLTAKEVFGMCQSAGSGTLVYKR